MKKLIMAAVVAIAAVASNAAVVDWRYKITGDAGGSDSEFAGYTAYLVSATYFEGLTKVTADSITGSGNYLQSATLSQTGSSGKGTNKKYLFTTASKNYANDDLAVGTEYNYYLVLVDSEGKTYNAVAYDYVARDPTGSPSEEAITYAVNGSALSFTNFAAADVPEPTSGMLMLLGIAGLALRRKRA